MSKLEKKYREYSYHRQVSAGCYQCNGSNIMWHGPNAQGYHMGGDSPYGLVWKKTKELA